MEKRPLDVLVLSGPLRPLRARRTTPNGIAGFQVVERGARDPRAPPLGAVPIRR